MLVGGPVGSGRGAVVDGGGGDALAAEHDGQTDGKDDADDEPFVVALADALVEPLAVVVEHVDALVAGGAVLGPRAGDADVAQVAAPVLDDVRVSSPVELLAGLVRIRKARDVICTHVPVSHRFPPPRVLFSRGTHKTDR